MTSDSTVRMAVPQDEESLMDACRQLHHENALVEMDEDKVRGLIRCALYPAEQRNNIISMVGVIGPVGAIESSCILIVSQMWFSRKWHLEEIINYVLPEFRKSHHAREMIKFMKKTAEQLAMPLIVGIISNKDTKRKCDMYDRLLTPVGKYYLHNGQTGHAEQAAQ